MAIVYCVFVQVISVLKITLFVPMPAIKTHRYELTKSSFLRPKTL